ncbi:endo-1,4-beta-xylanase [Mangrovimonas sp. DI 80]|uniref:endo-1,4-beta-xylanase n=1 Tax=Mangrovimonas sp. DI 80 TaxID=1779330 RepID=UPI00097538F9|nr:endo-1,4-beta-xylanase [Mangrovimonas sp. DI 80]OMP31202.1 1,4-beta-xylanase [Mangrovimonas sp. DI 80]
MKLKYLLLSLLIIGCKAKESKDTQIDKPQEVTSLKEALKSDFYIGTALNVNQIHERDAATNSVIKTHFNAIVAENCMKSGLIHPEKDTYFWEDADAFVNFGMKNNMFITGHTLAWHSQTPPWLFVDDQGNDVTREELIARMTDHITTVMTRYKGKVKGWDVVNEALNEDGTMRESKFYTIIGPDWVEIMFGIAQKVDPDTELYYNDYNLSNPEKRQGAVNLVKSIQEKGIKVTGIGMQSHVSMDNPDLKVYEESIEAFSKLGTVMITEFDLSVLKWPNRQMTADISERAAYMEKMDPFKTGLPDSMAMAQQERFQKVFNIWKKNSKSITRVTTWGVNDGNSWKNDFPIPGRTDYPLLFDRSNKAKPIVTDLIKQANTTNTTAHE